MDDIIATYILYAISFVLIVSLLSYSVFNYRASAKSVKRSSYAVEAANEEYASGGYSLPGYYLNGRAIMELKSNCYAIVLDEDDGSPYKWIYCSGVIPERDPGWYGSYLNKNVQDTLHVEGKAALREDEVYQVELFRTQSDNKLVYIVK